MFDVNEAVKTLRLLRCKNHFSNNEVLEYHMCLNIIEESLCDKDCVIVDLSTFDNNNPQECCDAIRRCI